MPSENGSVSLYDLIENEATATVKFPNGKAFTVRYRPDYFTPARLREMKRRGEEEEADDAEVLTEFVLGWDLAGPLRDEAGVEIVGEGESIPIDPDYVRHVHSGIIARVFRAVMEQISPEAKAPGERSRGRSFTPAR